MREPESLTILEILYRLGRYWLYTPVDRTKCPVHEDLDRVLPAVEAVDKSIYDFADLVSSQPLFECELSRTMASEQYQNLFSNIKRIRKAHNHGATFVQFTLLSGRNGRL